VEAREDVQQAGLYEQALKHRPPQFVVQQKLDNNIGTIRVGVNVASLAHRAAAMLPSGSARTGALAIGRPEYSWRLVEHSDRTEKLVRVRGS
jgi:hypothetical protein